MAPSFMKKTMVYLGLLDDEYDEYDDLDNAPRGFTTSRVQPQVSYDDREDEFSGGMSRVRTIPRESAQPAQSRPQPSNITPRPQPVRPVALPVDSTLSPVSAVTTARVHVVAPARFGDAMEIADRLK